MNLRNAKGDWKPVTIVAVSATAPGFKIRVDAISSTSFFSLLPFDLTRTSLRHACAYRILDTQPATEPSPGSAAAHCEPAYSGPLCGGDDASRSAVVAGAAGAGRAPGTPTNPTCTPAACPTALQQQGAGGIASASGCKRARHSDGTAGAVLHGAVQVTGHGVEQPVRKRQRRSDPAELDAGTLAAQTIADSAAPPNSARGAAAQSRSGDGAAGGGGSKVGSAGPNHTGAGVAMDFCSSGDGDEDGSLPAVQARPNESGASAAQRRKAAKAAMR